jgi:tetratricopeptide (TPR) repeat protein
MRRRTTDRGGHWRRAAIRCCAGIAGACQYAGRLGSAARVLRAALVLSGRAPSGDQLQIAVLNRLGVVLKTAGRYDDAAICYAHVQSALDELRVPCLDARAALHHNVAGLAYARGDHENAEREIRKALAIRGRAAADHAADEGLLGAVLVGQGRRVEARPLLNRVLAEMEQAYGRGHYEVAVVLQNLAVLDQHDDPLRAQQLYERAVTIKQRRLGRAHPEVGVLLNNLATLHHQQRRREVALDYCAAARDILRRRYGLDHPATRTCERNFRRIHRSQ